MCVQETLKSVVAQYNASQLLTQREVGGWSIKPCVCGTAVLPPDAHEQWRNQGSGGTCSACSAAWPGGGVSLACFPCSLRPPHPHPPLPPSSSPPPTPPFPHLASLDFRHAPQSPTAPPPMPPPPHTHSQMTPPPAPRSALRRPAPMTMRNAGGEPRHPPHPDGARPLLQHHPGGRLHHQPDLLQGVHGSGGGQAGCAAGRGARQVHREWGSVASPRLRPRWGGGGGGGQGKGHMGTTGRGNRDRRGRGPAELVEVRRHCLRVYPVAGLPWRAEAGSGRLHCTACPLQCCSAVAAGGLAWLSLHGPLKSPS